jgi:hypothetical protein
LLNKKVICIRRCSQSVYCHGRSVIQYLLNPPTRNVENARSRFWWGGRQRGGCAFAAVVRFHFALSSNVMKRMVLVYKKTSIPLDFEGSFPLELFKHSIVLCCSSPSFHPSFFSSLPSFFPSFLSSLSSLSSVASFLSFLAFLTVLTFLTFLTFPPSLPYLTLPYLPYLPIPADPFHSSCGLHPLPHSSNVTSAS